MNIGKESEQLEFKASLAQQKSGFESIAAILNKHGRGTLYFGVDDNGDVIGVQAGKATLNHLSRDLESHVNPSFFHSVRELTSADGKQFIEVTFEGYNTPYSAFGRFFLRFADRDKVMDQAMLLNYLERKKRSYETWETSDSHHSIDDVNEYDLKAYIERGQKCGRIGFEYTSKQIVLRKLGLLYDDRNLNNAGNVLFSKNNPLKVKFATYQTEERLTIVDMKLFEGNIFDCIDATQKYIAEHISWKVVFDGGIKSKEIPEIPLEAIREIVVNAFAHGSYERIATEFEVTIFRDRVIIYSPGHFPSPFTPEQFAFDGLESIPLNTKICDILYMDETIEKHSTGFERAFAYCAKEHVKYDYADTGLGFRFIFYRKTDGTSRSLSATETKVRQLLNERPSLTAKDLSQKIGVSQRTISRAISKLKNLGYLIRVGGDKDGYWKNGEN